MSNNNTNLKPDQHREHLSTTSATKMVATIGGLSKMRLKKFRMRVSHRTSIMEAGLTCQRRRSRREGDSS